jgi:hypothetical protein
VIDLAHLENFSVTGSFSGAKNRKNEAVFREFFEMVASEFELKHRRQKVTDRQKTCKCPLCKKVMYKI